jgi:hypothetical protein
MIQSTAAHSSVNPMTSLDQVILKSTNPFDSYRAVNFWLKQRAPEPLVESIHRDAITAIATVLDQLAQDHYTQTTMLVGDAGSGKTYLLGRLKQKLNPKAIFTYIPPFPQSDQFWRHVLRYTVESLIQVPDGQQESQLLLWLKSLAVYRKRTWADRVDRFLKEGLFESMQSDRQLFIRDMRNAYRQAGIDNADNFFGVLYDLTNPTLYPIACDWLRGNDMNEISLQMLGVSRSIESEEAAYETLANFGKISEDTRPIVLCFDQLESVARLPNGELDLQALFIANTKIHDENRNFLVIISITTDTWRQHETRIDQSHKDRIDQQVNLRKIDLEQAEALLASRLHGIHAQITPPPVSRIAPFTRQHLEAEFPGFRTDPRNVLKFGRALFQEYKQWLLAGSPAPGFRQLLDDRDRPDRLANFQLSWLDELNKVRQQVTGQQFSSPELMQMLQEVLLALQFEDVRTPLFVSTKYASYSLGFRVYGGTIGVVWAEDPNMTTFFNIMDACRKALEQGGCQTLYLIRQAEVGQPNLKGNQLYCQIFTGNPHTHLQPDLASIHYLATYYNLVKDAREGDLVVGGETINLKALRELIQESRLLSESALLQGLGVVTAEPEPAVTNGAGTIATEIPDRKLQQQVENFVLNYVKTQPVMGLQLLSQNTLKQFPAVNTAQVTALMQRLVQSDQIRILNPEAPLASQIVSLAEA